MSSSERRSREHLSHKAKRKRSRSSSSSQSSDRSSTRQSTKTTRKKRRKKASNRFESHHSRDSSTSSSSECERKPEKTKVKHMLKKKQKSKKKKKEKKKKKKKSSKKSKDISATRNESHLAINVSSANPSTSQGTQLKNEVPAARPTSSIAVQKRRPMVPMTKEEYERQQSIVRRVVDPETGRSRLVKGDGEIIEEIVSFSRHREINKQATKADGEFFQKSVGIYHP